ncbi:hypothetical protein TcasGA2_TC005275 [Tribolium castaneum]|uniref:YqaJ viral recombinase domain-containing protein n=1 Tax=Tribolium castaneum TaxID=7070 RepID=D7GXW9_TRICA|nr:hypothetical protein TcasGA2_TC005275 [Tribolium castaneum]
MEKISENSGIYTTKFSNRLLKTKELQATKLNKRKIRIQSADSDYGATNDIIDMPTETYDKIKNEFLNDLDACDILKIPLLTIGQRNNEQWDKERNNRLTASNFGRIINMKCTTNTANAVKDILYRVGLSKFKKLPEPLQWGIDNEEKAKEKFEQIKKKNF